MLGHILLYDVVDGVSLMPPLYFRIHPRSSIDLTLTCFSVINLFKYLMGKTAKICLLRSLPVCGTQLVINACESLSHGNLGA